MHLTHCIISLYNMFVLGHALKSAAKRVRHARVVNTSDDDDGDDGFDGDDDGYDGNTGRERASARIFAQVLVIEMYG